jgi:MFS family permease
LVAFLFGVGLYAAFSFVPEFVQTPASFGYGFHASITQSGFFVLPMSVAIFVLGLVTGRLARRFGARLVVIVGAVISVIPFVMLAAAHDQKWEIYVAMALLGAGFGLAFSAMSVLIVESVPPDQTGVASGMNANIRTVGGAIGAGVMASLVTSGAVHGVPKESGYTHGFTVLAVTAVLAAVVAVAIPSIRRFSGAHPAPEDGPHAELAVLAAGTIVGSGSE